jgi:DNA-binding transcriptional LysR family regulator
MSLFMPWNDRTKRRLKLRDLDILMAVIDTGSMGKAAKRLNVSQPAVSKAIVEMEDALGVPLVDRSRSGVEPTRYGLALQKRSISIFNDLRHGVQDIDFLLDPTKGEIHVGATEPVMAAIVSPVLNGLLQKHPGMHFQIVAGDTASLYRDVASRNIEIAICRMIGRLPEELEAETLFRDAVAIMTVASNPITRRRNLTLSDLHTEPWVMFPYDSFFGGMIAEIFRKNGLDPPRQTVSTLSVHAQNELLATGRFLTVLPSFVLKFPGGHLPLKAVPVELPNPPVPVGLITPKNRTLTPAVQLFIEGVRNRVKMLNKSRSFE